MSTGSATFLASRSVEHCTHSDSRFPTPGAHPGRGRLAWRRPRYKATACCDFGLPLPLSEFCVFPVPDPLTPTALLTGEKGVCQPGVQAWGCSLSSHISGRNLLWLVGPGAQMWGRRNTALVPMGHFGSKATSGWWACAAAGTHGH